MEFENKSDNYQALISVCSELINQYGLHRADGPVSLQSIIDDFDIEMVYAPLPEGTHGYAITDPENNVPAQIVINSFDSPELQSETIAHEIVHLVKHAHERIHHWWDGIADLIQENEALLGAAYLKVPLGYLLEMAREGLTSEVIAAELKVRKELVELRWKAAVESDELKGIFDDVPDTTKTNQRVLINPPETSGEVEIIGQAIAKKPIKTPIGEVQSYQPKIIEGTFDNGATYIIGDPERLAYWESLPDNFEKD
jgi:hypothetical protein